VKFLPKKLFVEKSIKSHYLTKRIKSKLPHTPIEYVNDYREIGKDKPFPEMATEYKDYIALAERKGEFVKNIGRMNEEQYYLFHELDCHYDCEYCYLQYYFQTKIPVIFVNRDELLEKIEEILISDKQPYFHVGEVCDALALDHLTDFSKEVIPLFSKYKNGSIEFRTKSVNVENLISIEDVPNNVIPSWTFSPTSIANIVEHKTPSFSDRLIAAKKCQKAGYTVGVRIDPMIRVDNWEEKYVEMINEILTELDKNKIDYITLGTIKMHKNLLEKIKLRYPKSDSVLGEIFPSNDGKYRYLKFQRVEMYKKLTNAINRLAPRIKIELSLESNEVNDLVFS